MKTPVLPILLGLSLCGIGGALVYVYLKKKDEQDIKKQKSNDINDKLIIINKNNNENIYNEILIENDIVPIVLGRSGANVKSIEEKTGATIKFREYNENKHVCEIRGDSISVKNAIALIKQSTSRPDIKVELSVPQSACGKIIGRCGEALQEICRKSLAKVSVDSGDRGDGKTRVLVITGTQHQVNIAKMLVEEKINEDALTRKLLEENLLKREPRCLPRSANSTPPLSTSRESIPPKVEKLNSTNNDGLLEVYVSAVANPSRFWLQLVGPQSSELDNLVGRMTDYYSNIDNQKLHQITEPYLGQIVAAMFKFDSKWYRAEIVSIQPNDYCAGELVLDLYFVDYGDSEYCGPHEICELRTDFLTLRFQAIECFLANVKPVTNQFNEQNSELWDEQSTGRFEELTHVAQWTKLVSRVVTYKERTINNARIRREGSPVPGVELFDPNEDRDINVAAELVAEGYALHSDESSSSLSLKDDISVDTKSMSLKNNNEAVLRLNGGNDKILINNNNNEKNAGSDFTNNNNKETDNANPKYQNEEKYLAILENTTNENYENLKKDEITDNLLSLTNGNSNGIGRTFNNNNNKLNNFLLDNERINSNNNYLLRQSTGNQTTKLNIDSDNDITTNDT